MKPAAPLHQSSVSSSAPPARSRKLHAWFVAASCIVALGAGCSHRKDPDKEKPYKPKRVRDPVEQKVFYDGWWPENW